MTSPPASLRARIASILTAKRLPWWLAALSALLLAPSLGMGLVVDDFVIRSVETGHDIAGPMTPFDVFRFCNATDGPELIEHGAVPWWASPKLKLAFFRPLASASHWLDHRLFPSSPAAQHLVSIVWAAAIVIVGCAVYRRLMGAAWPAGLAALFFAIDPGHAVAAGWVAARNSLLAAFFGLAALWAHDRWRREGDGRAAWIAPLCTALSLASGESGAAVLALIFAHAIAFDGPRLATRARALAPSAAIALVWAVVYRGLGYGAANSAMYTDPVASPAAYLRKAAMSIPVNLGSRLGGPPAALATFAAERTLPVLAIVSLAFIVITLAALGPLRRTPAARFFAVAALLSALPVAGTMPSDRNLFFIGFAGFGLLALVARRAAEGAPILVRIFAGWIIFLEVVIALPSALASATSMNLFAKHSRDPLSRVLLDEGARDTLAVFVNPPTPFFVATLVPTRLGTGLPVPSRVRALVPGIYASRLRRDRVDQITVHVDGGILPRPGTWPAAGGEAPAFKLNYVAQHLSSFVRGPDEPMRAGDVVTMQGTRVEVLAVSESGGPTEVRFTFDKPLEDPKLRWLAWQDGAYVPFTLPPVGGEVALPPATMKP